VGRSGRQTAQRANDPKASRPGVPHTALHGATVHDAFPPPKNKKKSEDREMEVKRWWSFSVSRLNEDRL